MNYDYLEVLDLFLHEPVLYLHEKCPKFEN